MLGKDGLVGNSENRGTEASVPAILLDIYVTARLVEGICILLSHCFNKTLFKSPT